MYHVPQAIVQHVSCHGRVVFRLRSDSLNLRRWTLKHPEDHLGGDQGIEDWAKIENALTVDCNIYDTLFMLEYRRAAIGHLTNDVLAGVIDNCVTTDTNEVISALTVTCSCPPSRRNLLESLGLII